MIEVNLFSIPTRDAHSRVGKCVARVRVDQEAIGTSIEEFTHSFLKDNAEKVDGISEEVLELINSDSTFTRSDIASLNYFLINSGFIVMIWNVADDEDNPVSVESDMVEWNVLDNNFIQHDYPTSVKIIPGEGLDIPGVLHKIVEGANVFGPKFEGMKNPFTGLLDSLDRIKGVTGSVDATIVSRIYDYLDQLGISVFCATSED